METSIQLNNQILLYGCFNQYVFSECKMNLKYLKMYYKDKFLYDSNTLIKRLIDLIEVYDYKDLTESRFLLTLQQDGKSEAEANAIYSKISSFQNYTKEQASVFTENLRQLCYSAYINRAQKLYGDNSVRYLDELKAFEYKSNYDSVLIAKNFSELDITDLASRYSGEGYKSRYKFINNSYSCGGYIPGQLIVVCAPPSVGKSLFLESEAVNFIKQGKRVHILVMADLNEADLVVRMICQISGKSQREVESDIIGNYNLYKNMFKDYLSITCVPAGVVSARDYVDWVLQRKDEFDVLMVDYYGNFAEDEDRSMYLHGGDVCNALTELVRIGKLVFLACQPIKSYYGEEFLPYEAVGESSKIVQVADMIITMGRRYSAGMRMGKFNIAKGRRCLPDCDKVANWIATNDGLFFECSDTLYWRYMNDDKHYKLFSYSELTAMDSVEESIADQFPQTLENAG